MRLLLVLGGVAMLGTNLQAEPKAGVDLAQLKGWDILLGADAIPSERYAAQEFQRLFTEATGNRLAIRVESDDADSNVFDRHVFLGDSKGLRRSHPDLDLSECGEEDLRIVIGDQPIGIAGGRPRGSLYGVYTFLEDDLGVRFLTAYHTHVPPLADRHVVGPLDLTYRPPLLLRWSYYGETNNHPEFAARARCNIVPTEGKFGGKTDRLEYDSG